jgi:hypothetical protein
MIARHWGGWTEPQSADAYESLLTNKVLPGLRALQGIAEAMSSDRTVRQNANLS